MPETGPLNSTSGVGLALPPSGANAPSPHALPELFALFLPLAAWSTLPAASVAR